MILAAAAGWSLALGAAARQPELSADNPIILDAESQCLVATGNAVFTDGEFILRADEIRYNKGERLADAKGRVEAGRNGFLLAGEHFTYQGQTGIFSGEHFRLGGGSLFAEGGHFEGTLDRVEARDVRVWFREPDPYAPSLEADTLVLYPGKRFEAEKVKLRAGPLPVFYLPGFARELNRPWAAAEARAGYRGNLGAYGQSEVLLPAGETWRAGGNLDYYTKRGVLIGPAWRAEEKGEESGYTHYFSGGFIRDYGERGLDRNAEAVPPDRYFAEARHRQRWRERWEFNSQLSWRSDSEVTRDFRRRHFHTNQQPDSFAEGLYLGRDYTISVFMRPRPNDFQLIHERLPEIRFDLAPKPLSGTGACQSLHAAAVRLRKESLEEENRGISADKFGLHYSLQRPVSLTRWLTLTPLAGCRVIHYTGQEEFRSGNNRHLFRDEYRDYTRWTGELGADLEMAVHGQWDFRNEIWEIDGLRHVLRPVAKYRWHPDSGTGGDRILPVETFALAETAGLAPEDFPRPFEFAPAAVILPPLDLEDIRYVDEQRETHVLRMGLENLLLTRHPGYGSRHLAELNLYQDFLFEPDEPGPATVEGERHWNATCARLFLNPAPWLDLSWENRLNTEKTEIAESAARLVLKSGDAWQAVFTANYWKPRGIRLVSQYSLDVRCRPAPELAIRALWRYDEDRGGLTEHLYAVTRRLGRSWEISCQLRFREDARREEGAALSLHARLLTD